MPRRSSDDILLMCDQKQVKPLLTERGYRERKNLQHQRPEERNSLAAYKIRLLYSSVLFAGDTTLESRLSAFFERTDVAIDLSGVECRNNIRILKLSHPPLYA